MREKNKKGGKWLKSRKRAYNRVQGLYYGDLSLLISSPAYGIYHPVLNVYEMLSDISKREESGVSHSDIQRLMTGQTMSIDFLCYLDRMYAFLIRDMQIKRKQLQRELGKSVMGAAWGDEFIEMIKNPEYYAEFRNSKKKESEDKEE